MKLFLYSDVHISKTSSILPLHSSNAQYTYRQNMILQTGDWLSQLVINEKPDAIINLGDTYDQHTLTSYDVNVASKFFDYFTTKLTLNNLSIPHYVLVGNHEMVNGEFNAVALLNNISGITVIDEPTTINDLAFLPYCDYKTIYDFPEGKFLFSHQDIQGSSIRGDFVLPNGIVQDSLKQYKLVFNGHIHKSSIMNNIINIGSVTTHSFSDDESSVPQAYIFDTETMNFEAFKNMNCPLFRKATVENELDLAAFIEKLDKSFKYVLHINCPYEFKDIIKNDLINNSYIINSKLTVRVNKEETSESKVATNLQSNVDIKQSFQDFLNLTELKYPQELYLKVLEDV